jgi:hypothetical protein
MGSVGQTEKLRGKGVIIPLFLSLTKSLFLPIITRYTLIPVFMVWNQTASKRDLFVNFIFLVSAIPTAASTPVICAQFVRSREITGMVAGTKRAISQYNIFIYSWLQVPSEPYPNIIYSLTHGCRCQASHIPI